MRIVFVLATIAMCVGCSSTPHISNKSIAFNDAVEMDENIGVLKNAVRASQRLPLEYTRIANLTYTGRMTGEAGATVGLGSGRPGEVPLALEIGSSDNAQLIFERLTGEAFFKAISRPVSLGELQAFWQQGWPRTFLLMLTLERIEMAQFVFCDIKMRDERMKGVLRPAFERLRLEYNCDTEYTNRRVILDNDPEEPWEFYGFLAVLRHLTREGVIAVVSKDQEKALTFSTANIVSAEANLLEWAKANDYQPKQKVENEKSQIEFVKKTTTMNLAFDRERLFNEISRAKEMRDRRPNKGLQRGDDRTFQKCNFNDGDENGRSLSIDVTTDSGVGEGSSSFQTCVSVITRAPDAVVYFLGELLRVQQQASEYAGYRELCRQRNNPAACVGDHLRLRTTGPTYSRDKGHDGPVLFVVHDKAGGIYPFDRRRTGLGVFEFKYLGKRYAVPADPYERGRTMQAVSLVKQLVGARQNAPETLELNTFTINPVSLP